MELPEIIEKYKELGELRLKIDKKLLELSSEEFIKLQLKELFNVVTSPYRDVANTLKCRTGKS